MAAVGDVVTYTDGGGTPHNALVQQVNVDQYGGGEDGLNIVFVSDQVGPDKDGETHGNALSQINNIRDSSVAIADQPMWAPI
jgi:hypothetical protein